MEEDIKKTEETNKEESKSVKKVNAKKTSDAKKERHSIKSVLGIYKGEFDKIIWPSRQDLVKMTLTVIVTSLMVGAIISIMDQIFRSGYLWMLELIS